MPWWLILEEVGSNINNIDGFDKKVSDKLTSLPSESIEQVKTSTRRAKSWADKLFAISVVHNNNECLPLDILIVQTKQQKYLGNKNSKLCEYMKDWRHGYYHKVPKNDKIICYYRNIYVLQTFHRSVLYWYHIYLKHPGGSRLVNKTRKVCYWKLIIKIWAVC